MKNFLLVIFLTMCSNFLIAQSESNLFVGFKSGITTLYSTGQTGLNLPEITYLGFIYWDNNRAGINAINLQYETSEFVLFNQQRKTIIDFSIFYKGYLDKQFYNFLGISNSLYYPKKVHDKKFDFNWGIRNTLIIRNFVTRENDELIDRRTYILGGELLARYKIGSKISIGLTTYLDLSPVAGSRNRGLQERTGEILLGLSYKIQ